MLTWQIKSNISSSKKPTVTALDSGGLWQGTTKIASCFYHLVTWYHVGNEKQYVFNPLSPPQPNLTWWWLLIGGQHPFRHWHFGRVLMCGHATNGKCYIFFSTKPQVNTHGRVVVLDKGLLTTKSRDSSIKWSRKKHRNLIYPLSPGLWPPNRTGWLLKLSQVKRTLVMWSREITWQMKSVNPLFGA